MHLRQNGADLDGAITLTDLSTVIKDWPQLLPRLNAIADVTLAGKAGMVDGSDTAGLYGASGELRRLVADIGEGRTMRISGPFSFDNEGYLRPVRWRSKSSTPGRTMPSRRFRSCNPPSIPPAKCSAHSPAAATGRPSTSWWIAAAPPSAVSFRWGRSRRFNRELL